MYRLNMPPRMGFLTQELLLGAWQLPQILLQTTDMDLAHQLHDRWFTAQKKRSILPVCGKK